MKAAQIKQYGQDDVIEINKTVLSPISSAGRVLIEVYAAGVNPFDWQIREGHFENLVDLRFPLTLGIDFSGVILHVGEQVSGFKKDDEVYGQSSLLNGWGGSFAEFVSADAKAIALKPANTNHLEAASLPLVGVSAYRALIEHMHLSKGQKILIHGGAGGVGSMAIQLAKHLGAFVTTTVSFDDILFVTGLGADEVIDYNNRSFEKVLFDYDAVLDTVGGETYLKSYQILKPGGIIVSLIEKPNPKLVETLKINAVFQSTQVTDTRLNELAKLIEQGVLHPQLDKVFSLANAKAALNYQQSVHPQGKVVLQIPSHPLIKKIKDKLKKFMKKEIQQTPAKF